MLPFPTYSELSPYTHGSTVTVSCALNYQVDANGATATCINGNWSFIPQCVGKLHLNQI